MSIVLLASQIAVWRRSASIEGIFAIKCSASSPKVACLSPLGSKYTDPQNFEGWQPRE